MFVFFHEMICYEIVYVLSVLMADWRSRGATGGCWSEDPFSDHLACQLEPVLAQGSLPATGGRKRFLQEGVRDRNLTPAYFSRETPPKSWFRSGHVLKLEAQTGSEVVGWIRIVGALHGREAKLAVQTVRNGFGIDTPGERGSASCEVGFHETRHVDVDEAVE